MNWGRLIAGAGKALEVATSVANAAVVGAEAIQAAKLVIDRQKAARKPAHHTYHQGGARVARSSQHKHWNRHR